MSYVLIKDKKMIAIEEDQKEAVKRFESGEADQIREIRSLSEMGEVVAQLNEEEDDWGKIKNWFTGFVRTGTDAINKEADRLMEEAEATGNDLETKVKACINLAQKAGSDKLEELRNTFERKSDE